MKDTEQLVSQAQLVQLAEDVLSLAAAGGMPDTFWQTDQRIRRACVVMHLRPDQARQLAEHGEYGQARR